MSARQNVLTVAAAVAAVVMMSSVGVYYSVHTQSHPAVDMATKVTKVMQVSATDRMKAVLLPADELPTGTQFQQFTAQSFAAQHGYDAPQGITFTPASCLQYDTIALGNPASYQGWVQFGVIPPTANGLPGQFAVTAYANPGGFDLSKIGRSAATCSAGSLSVPSMGVTAGVSLGTYVTPTFAGAKTLGITITTTFSSSTSPEMRAAVLGQCAEPQVETVADTSPCHLAAMKEMANTTTDTRYAAYLTVDDTIVAACESSEAAANDMLATLYQRVLSQGK